jgi:hypothetical protein
MKLSDLYENADYPSCMKSFVSRRCSPYAEV